MKKVIAAFIVLFLFPSSVWGVSNCSTERIVELEKEASFIKLTYSEEEEELDSSEYFRPDSMSPDEEITAWINFFNINVLNLTKDYYIELTNNINDEVIHIRHSDLKEDGMYSYKWSDLSKVTTFTASVFTSSETECSDEKIRIIYLTTPRVNEYANEDVCIGRENEEICSKYITVNEISYDSFIKKLEESKTSSKPEKETNKEKEGILTFLKENRRIISISTGSIVILSGVIIVLLVKRRKVN